MSFLSKGNVHFGVSSPLLPDSRSIVCGLDPRKIERESGSNEDYVGVGMSFAVDGWLGGQASERVGVLEEARRGR